MKIILVLLAGIVLSLGCARVKVEAPKEPIKVDISMRLDIYQHIEKDIDAIEGIVSGSKEKARTKDNHSLLNYFIVTAYADEDLSPEIEQAALRRRDRLEALSVLEEKGLLGENKSGLVEARGSSSDAKSKELIEKENNDRMVIYRSVAQKNNSSIDEVQKLYAKRLQEKAPAGTPIEVFNDSTGTCEWKIK